MGCGISKFNLEEKEQNAEVTFIYPRNEQATTVNEYKDGNNNNNNKDQCGGDQDEIESLTSHGRKSVSSLMNYERGFLKRVFGSNDQKDKENVEAIDHNGRKSVSSSTPPIILENGLFEKENGSFPNDHQDNKDANATKVVDPMELKVEKEVPEERRPSLDLANEEGLKNMEHKQIYNGEDLILKENSLLSPPGSPSFRIYCLLDESANEVSNNEDYVNVEKKKSRRESEKGQERQPLKRGRRTSLLRTVLQRGGSVGMKNFLNVSHRSSVNSSNSQDSTNSNKLSEKKSDYCYTH